VTVTSIMRAHRHYRPAYADALRSYAHKLVRLRTQDEVRRFLENPRSED